MAALKKTIKKKDTGKPSTALIIALVFFILISIGAAVTAYYGFDGQNKLREEAASAKKGLNAQKSVDDYRMGVIHMLASASGQNLDAEYENPGKAALEEIIKEGGKYNEKDRKTWADLFNEIQKDLTFDANEKKFKENYRTKFKQTLADLEKTKSQLDVTQKAYKDSEARYTTYTAKIEEYFKNAQGQIKKGADATLTASNKRSEAFEDLVKLNKEIHDQKLDAEAKLKDALDKLSIEQARVLKIMEEKKGPMPEVVQTKKDGDQSLHALFLDLSRGVALWDRPVGKVTRVDLERRQVFINLGSDLGVRPELTFNIFADNGKGQADKFLKGTIEVIRVIDGQTSLCRITSLYDSTGVEIALNDPTRGRAAREVEAGVREGDLLFNLFWNSHVAVAGAINFTGFSVDAPSEQMRNLEMFMQLLGRMNIHTDAYLDLTDGQTKGTLSGKTRFLILGDSIYPKNTSDETQKEQAKVINDGITAMKKDAIEKGVFLISAENFSIAAGYRKPRNASNIELGKFSSTVPLAGVSESGGLVIQRDRAGAAAPKPMPEKKDEKKVPEPKEKELKEKEAK